MSHDVADGTLAEASAPDAVLGRSRPHQGVRTVTAPRPRTRALSDRAHRVLFTLVLRPDRVWVDLVVIYTALGLNSHQVRTAVNELRKAGMAERRYRYETTETGRRVKHTEYRLTSEASA